MFVGYTAHVMTFEVGAVLEDSKWQAPVYCFKEADGKSNEALIEFLGWSDHLHGKLMRQISSGVSMTI